MFTKNYAEESSKIFQKNWDIVEKATTAKEKLLKKEAQNEIKLVNNSIREQQELIITASNKIAELRGRIIELNDFLK